MLKAEIEDFINTAYDPLKKEYNFVKAHDWTKNVNFKSRVSEQGLHSIITNRAVSTAKDLHKIAIADLDHKEVKKVFAICKKIFDLHEKRYHSYTKSQDWEDFISEGKDINEAQDEIKFQNDIRNELNGFKRTMRSINFGEDESKINIPTYNDQVIPLVMRDSMEEKFPEIKKFIENVISKSRKSKK